MQISYRTRVTVVVRRHLTAVAAVVLTLSAVTTYAVAAGDPAMVTARAALRHSSPVARNPGSPTLVRALPSAAAFAGSCNPSDPSWANRDDDGDGVCNGLDNCPFEFNPDQAAAGGTGAACVIQAITVPSQTEYPTAPHVTYSGAITTVKGIVRYAGTGVGYQYRWDFGDGLSAAWSSISDPYDLGVSHVYTGVDGQLFMATLSVRNTASGDIATAQYPVVIKDGGTSIDLLTRAQTDVRAQLAIDEALWYQHRNVSRGTFADGAPGYRQPYALAQSLTDACAAVDAFAFHGHRASGDWRGDPYVEDARSGLNYMLVNASVRGIAGGQGPSGSYNPDVNGNGFGVAIGPDNPWTNGVCAMALGDSSSPGASTATGPSGVYGRKYSDVAQDVVDWLAYGQTDSGAGEGGWGFNANGGPTTNENTRWVVMGLIALEARMGATVPTWVRGELGKWMNYAFHSAADSQHGSTGDYGPTSFNNVAFTAGFLLDAAFTGNYFTPLPTQQAAVGYIARSWLVNDQGGQTNLGDSNAMFSVARAFRALQPSLTTISDFNYILGTPDLPSTFDWYYGPASAPQSGYAGNLLARQRPDGAFTDAPGYQDYNSFSPIGLSALATEVLSPRGAPATATLSAPSLDFGSVLVNTTSTAQLITLTNQGDQDLVLDSIAASGPFSATSTCGSLLPPAGMGVPNDCTISITFTPTATGTASGSLTVAGSAALGLPSTSIPLSGVGILKLAPAITWPAPAAITYGSTLGAAQLNATATVPGAFVYTPAAGTALNAGVGQPLTLSFTPNDTIHYSSATATTLIDVAPANPILTVTSGSSGYDGQPHAATATATGVNGVPLGPVAITYNGQLAAPSAAGTYAVVATLAASGNYALATATTTLVITAATPAITWLAPAAITYGAGLGAALNASANTPGTFVYTPAAGAVLNAGVGQALAVTFTPADSTDYGSATATTTIDVARATPVVTVTGGAFVYNGQPHAATATATGVNGVPLGPVAITYNGQLAAPSAAGTYAVVATLAASGNYALATATTTLVITAATPAITWPAPPAMTYGTALGAALNASANVPGTFVYTPAAGTVPNAGAGQTLRVTFTPTDSTDYSGATATTTIDVAPATPAVTATGGTFVYNGQPHAATAAATGVNGAPLVPVVVTYNGQPAVPVSAGVYTASATLAASGNYTAAMATATVTIAKATPVLSWVAPASVPVGTVLSATQLNATANVPGTFAYTPPAGTVLTAGTQTLSVVFSPSDGANYGTITASATLLVTSPPATGHFEGEGGIDSPGAHARFAFDVTVGAKGTTGELRFRTHANGQGRHDRDDDDDDAQGKGWNRFVSTRVLSASLEHRPGVSPGPKPSSGIDTVVFSGIGRWNHQAGYTFDARATDAGEPGRGRDRFTLTVKAPNGAVVASVDGVLTSGNIQSAAR